MRTVFQKITDKDMVQRLADKSLYVRQGFMVGLGALVCLYLFLILLSYSSDDVAWSHISTHSLGATVKNIGGASGAYLADLLHTFFGVGAWAILLFVAYETYRVYVRTGNVQAGTTIAALRLCAYLFLWVCGCALLYVMGQVWTSGIEFGGVVGHEVYVGLLGLLGRVGALVFCVLMMAVVTWLLIDRHKNHQVGKKSTVSTTIDAYRDKKVKKQTDSITTSDNANYQTYQSHEHKGALESFLAYSGIRDDLVREQEKKDKEEAKQKEREAIQAQSSHVQHESPVQPTPSIIDDDFVLHDTDEMVFYDEPNAFDGIDIEQIMQNEHLSGTKALHKTSELMFGQEILRVATDNPTYSQDTLLDKSDNIQNQSFKPQMGEVDEFDVKFDVRKFDVETAHHQDASYDISSVTQGVPGVVPTAEVVKSIAVNKSQTVPQMPVGQLQAQSSDVPNVKKPDVHDDERFAKQSYAMQTAKYRESLPPLPEMSLLESPDVNKKPSYNPFELRQLSELLEIKLQEFRIKAKVVSVAQGPVVTLFEVELAPGLKASKVSSIASDLARSLSMSSCRVIEVLPGKPYIGIEVPNKTRMTVRLAELLAAPQYHDQKALLSMAMGTDIGGQPVISDLAKAPHMLVAGTTGSGKSVLMNSVMLSFLLKYTPEQLRLILIDPKQVELAPYSDIPHLLSPVITDMTEATTALSWCVEEMERRYELLKAFKLRHVVDLNAKIKEANARGESLLDPLWKPSDSVSDTIPKLKPFPLIVVVADEFADLMMQVGKQAEELIARLAQKSRACGIHLILATQRPSANVVTGLIKSNIPVRAALRVGTGMDSRIILDEMGAENMLGNGDMLFIAPGQNTPQRVHGAYVSDNEVNRICDAWRERGSPDYVDMASQTSMDFDILTGGSTRRGSGSDDEFYDEAVNFVIESGKTSISALQRGIGVGYNRAANLIEAMESNGILSAPDRSGKRTLLSGD